MLGEGSDSGEGLNIEPTHLEKPFDGFQDAMVIVKERIGLRETIILGGPASVDCSISTALISQLLDCCSRYEIVSYPCPPALTIVLGANLLHGPVALE